MSAWPGKYVIGLTGNIGVGKSVVRRMLEHLGAYGIDADALSNRTIAREAPGYRPVLDLFGRYILGADEQIDRARLGRMVFSDPEALARLEAIIHPLVFQALDILIRRSRHSVIVVEAIKLIESGLADRCDTVWAVYAPQEKQAERLVSRRNMSEAAALQRIHAQSPQDQKIAAAHTVIRNDGAFENTWLQVATAWNTLFPPIEVEPLEVAEAAPGELLVHRARPREAEEIAALISQLDHNRRMTRDDVMAAFGEKAFLLLRVAGRPLGVVGWKVEYLVARTDDLHIDESLSFIDAVRALLNEVERVSRELQCEISLVFLPQSYREQAPMFQALGYQLRTIENLGVRAWEEAAQESMPPDSVMFFKQLRQDRVLKPV